MSDSNTLTPREDSLSNSPISIPHIPQPRITSIANLKQKLNATKNLSPNFGEIISVETNIIKATGLSPSVGDVVWLIRSNETRTEGIVIATHKEIFSVSPFSFTEGFKSGDKVTIAKEGLNIPVGEGLLGRVINPLGIPLDNKGNLNASACTPIISTPISALKRGLINEVFSVGVKSIDSLLTCGKGQKMGIFAGSGVGKSTLMGMIVKGSIAQIKVVALIGERGREVPEFIEKNLGGNLENTVLVVATSDDSPLMRKYGAFSAMAIAEFFKEQGHDVLFIMDSVTRFAMAQREIGLALGEPPTSKGYPPSVLSILPQLIERAGKEEGKGSITAFFTVLVEGDDLNDPIADQSRSILDGHIMLDRNLTDFGIYPPINILHSSSRVMHDIISQEHKIAARKFRRMQALLKENEVLIRIGSYHKGNDAELDEAIDKKSLMEEFLGQEENVQSNFNDALEQLMTITHSTA
ncbi:flagellar protein export ATPase FliI [Helicobacter sp. MIT 14-3879]|uniref:flagellar protein export ATPase FliI n=1 Tax=Helicobacter sp. MIT 14-3879 TaxID=2040649 RepID=UPI000E1E7AC7|nr:flagellar protein export ATPase FliI [Helicobacter sp. MIT 14-3879]RDU62219.1 flagellar protein export ATPase FliI [Helicobacter sp. MIT 14-3879]